MARGAFGTVATPGLMGRLIRLVTRAKVNHAVIDDGGGWLIEAAPSGARRVPLSSYDGLDIHWSRLSLTPDEGDRVAVAAEHHLGAPYSWVDDACIAIADLFGVHVPEWVRRRLASPDHLMCSQLVDVAYAEAGIPLFRDGRLPGDVTPGDLDDLITATQRAAVAP